MNTLIVDDDELSRKVVQRLVEKTGGLSLVASVSSALEAITVLKDESIDLILLDVEMPEMSGLEFIQSLRDRPEVILISGKQDYAVDAFQLDVADYLVKPVNPARFAQAIQKARERLAKKRPVFRQKDWVFVKKDTQMVKIPTATILHVEAMADYIVIHTEKGKHVALSTMHAISEKLPAERFMRIHRSHIIALERLTAVEDNTAIVSDRVIPIGATYREKLLTALNVI